MDIKKIIKESVAKVLVEVKQPTDATIKPHMSQYSVSDDPYDVAVELGKKHGWNQKQIEKAEKLIRKKYIKESVNEASLSKVYNAARKGSYPITLVAIEKGKVVDQKLVGTPEIVPAAFNEMQKEFPKAQINIEDRKGKILFKEVKLTEDFPGKGKTVKAKDLNYDMLDYFNRMNISLSINTKSKKNIKGSVGKMFNDLVFNGGDIDKKDIVSVKIIESTVKEGKLPKRFTVKTKKKIGDTLYNPGTYALKKKRSGGGIYLNMDNNQMLGVDEGDIKQLTENMKKGYTVVYRDKAFDKTYTAQIPPGISKAEIVKMLKKTIRVGLEIVSIDSLKESVNEAKVNYDFSEQELIRVLRQLKRGASTEVKMIKAFEKALGRKITKAELWESNIKESVNEADINKFEKKLDAMVASYVKDNLKLDKEEERKAFVELKKLIKTYSFSKMHKLRGEGINEASDVFKIFDEKQKLYSQAMDIEMDMKTIAMDVKQTRTDMEQEAEPGGGKVADRYGKELGKLEKTYDKKKKELKKIFTKLEKLEMM
jgi:hypothetical protein